MTFIVALIALSLERFFDWSHMRRFNGYFAYQRWVMGKLSGQSPYLVLAASIIPLLLIVGSIQLLLNGFLYGFAHLVFSLLVVLYCLGPKNLWADSFACFHPLAAGSSEALKNELSQLFDVKEVNDLQTLHAQLLGSMFIETNSRVFAIIFWYVLLGPCGAVLYRVIALLTAKSENEQGISSLNEHAAVLQRILDFLPIRLLTFFFALGGHFVKVFPYWSKQVVRGLSNNETLLVEAGLIAISGEEHGKIPEDGSAEKNAISLLDRSFVIFLVLIAVVGLII